MEPGIQGDSFSAGWPAIAQFVDCLLQSSLLLHFIQVLILY
jgi:hypothetical protein